MKTSITISDVKLEDTLSIVMNRPDAHFATTLLAKCVQHPEILAWSALTRCLRDLNKSGPMRLVFDGRVRNDQSLVTCQVERVVVEVYHDSPKKKHPRVTWQSGCPVTLRSSCAVTSRGEKPPPCPFATPVATSVVAVLRQVRLTLDMGSAAAVATYTNASQGPKKREV